MTVTVTITRDQLAYLVQDRGDEQVFTGAAELRAVLSDWLARVNGWRRVA